MATFLDNCKFTPTAGGTTDWTFSAAVSGYQSPSAAGVVNSNVYKYFAISADLTQWEIGQGAYNTSTGVLARTTILYSTNANAKVTFTLAPSVAIIAALEDLTPAQAQFGLGMANGTIVASVATNILTVAIKTLAGNDPSASDPVFFFFRDATSATGDYVCRTVTSALSMTTNATGATLGTANSAPFRLWVNAFDNAGTVVLAFWQSVTGGASPTAIAALDETSPSSTTGISGTATSAGTFYTPNGTSLTTKSFRILGYLDYGSGLTTAGTYASTPTKIQLFGPGVKKPNEVVQRAYATSSSATTNSTVTFVNAGPSVSISPTSSPNIIYAKAFCNALDSGANAIVCGAKLMRGGASGTQVGATAESFQNVAAGKVIAAAGMSGYDAPGTTSSTTYQAAVATNSAGTTVSYGNATFTPLSSIDVEEIMV